MTAFHARATQFLQSPWLILLLLLNFLIGLGHAPLFDLDEGAFSSATMEMLMRHDYITTYLGGDLRFDKPILIYWLQAASVSAFGLNEFALRLPSALCATLWCATLYAFVKQHLDASRAMTACILLASSLVVSMIARAAIADALLNLWLCLALCDAYRFLQQEKSAQRLLNKYALRAYLWIGLGVLTKGPVAILIPFVTMGLYAFFDKQETPDHQKVRRVPAFLRLIFNPLGWLICVAVFLHWYVAEYQAQGQAFIDGFILKHNLDRFSSTLEKHGGSIFYYLPVSLIVFLPATGFFLQLVWQRLRSFTKPVTARMDGLDIFCWCWFVFVFIFFSISKTQLPHYLLYGVTPVFILMARYREQLQSRWLVIIPPALLFIALIFLPEIAQRVIATSHDVDIVAMLKDGMHVLDAQYRVTLIVALLAMIAVAFIAKPALWARQLWIAVIFTLVIVNVVVPTYGAIQQGPVRAAVAYARGIQAPIVMWPKSTPSFGVYLHRVVPIREPQAGEVVFTRLKNAHDFQNASTLFSQGGIVLLQMPAQTPAK